MPKRAAPTIVLLVGRVTLQGIDARLRRAGKRVVRIISVETCPVQPRTWLPRLRRTPPPDTVVVSSGTAVEAGVRPWRQARTESEDPEYWAVGPGTARALRRAGIHRVHRPRTVGTREVAHALSGRKKRAVLYFRSNAAGPRLARALRAEGHRVTDVIVYRLVAPSSLAREDLRELARADLLVASSPSALSSLRQRLDPPTFVRLCRSTPLVVLGEHSRRAARGHGFRKVSVAPPTTAQRFTRHLLQELRNASK